METSVYDFLINDEMAECILSDEGPVVSYRGSRFATLADLSEAAPALMAPENLTVYCRISNFFFKGISFDFIEDIKAYQKGYEERRSYEKRRTEGLISCGADFGPFDVSEMHAPSIEGGNLVYFVEDAYYGIPYRVTSPFPASKERDNATYALLSG
jgi:hypothetical protein